MIHDHSWGGYVCAKYTQTFSGRKKGRWKFFLDYEPLKLMEGEPNRPISAI